MKKLLMLSSLVFVGSGANSMLLESVCQKPHQKDKMEVDVEYPKEGRRGDYSAEEKTGQRNNLLRGYNQFEQDALEATVSYFLEHQLIQDFLLSFQEIKTKRDKGLDLENSIEIAYERGLAIREMSSDFLNEIPYIYKDLLLNLDKYDNFQSFMSFVESSIKDLAKVKELRIVLGLCYFADFTNCAKTYLDGLLLLAQHNDENKEVLEKNLDLLCVISPLGHKYAHEQLLKINNGADKTKILSEEVFDVISNDEFNINVCCLSGGRTLLDILDGSGLEGALMKVAIDARRADFVEYFIQGGRRFLRINSEIDAYKYVNSLIESVSSDDDLLALTNIQNIIWNVLPTGYSLFGI